VSIDAQGGVGEAADVLAVQITVDPADLPACGLFHNPIGALRVAGGGLTDDWNFMAERPPEETGTAARHRLEEEGVRIMALRQRDTESGDALLSQPVRKGLGRALPAAISIGIEGQIDGSPPLAQLLKLARIEMGFPASR